MPVVTKSLVGVAKTPPISSLLALLVTSPTSTSSVFYNSAWLSTGRTRRLYLNCRKNNQQQEQEKPTSCTFLLCSFFSLCASLNVALCIISWRESSRSSLEWAVDSNRRIIEASLDQCKISRLMGGICLIRRSRQRSILSCLLHVRLDLTSSLGQTKRHQQGLNSAQGSTKSTNSSGVHDGFC